MIVLGAKTDYSFQRGFGTGAQWRARCEELGVTVLGLADYASSWGHAPFRDAFKGSDIRLLYGVQLPVVAYLDKDPRHSLVTLYAKHDFTELYQTVTLAHSQTYYRPRLTWKQVRSLTDCVVVVNHCMKTHRRIANSLEGAFSATDELTLPRVLDYAPRYPSPDHRVGFEILLQNSNQARIGEVEIAPIHLLRDTEMQRKFDLDAEDYVACEANAKTLAGLCVADIPRAGLLPYDFADKRQRLVDMAMGGAVRLGLAGIDQGDTYPRFFKEDYEARLKAELDVIVAKGFEDYFFFVHEICEWAESRMLIGPGRGSAGGSLLCYLLGITHVDPLRFGTMFERFIDVTRSDLPDIDIDFADNRRDEVHQFIRDRFGPDKFAKLGTLTELGGKSAFNIVARATDVPFEISREFGKWTEGGVQGQVIPPRWIFKNVEEAKPLLEKYPSMAIAGLLDEREHWDENGKQHVSHHGVHASGIVVAPKPVSNYGAVDREGVLAMDMRTAESMGFVKMDVLGLTTLSVIQEACDLAGINPRSLRTLDFNDLEVFDNIFNKDRVTGVFQFAGHTVRGLMKQIKVDKFDDICALTSLARPGPLQGGAAAGWVKARNGGEARASIHPALDATYGVICYQEQMMAICRDCAGFDVAGVNGMRRAVAKKDPEKLAAYRPKFIEGMTKFFLPKWDVMDGQDYSIAQKQAEELWEEICEFGYYAFNFAHATAYGMLSFMTAWLKLKHPLEFAVAQLKYAADEDDAKNLLRELIEEGYQYVPFDAARSQASWSVSNGQLVGGFDSIRGIGVKTAERLVAQREAFTGAGKWTDQLTEAMREKVISAKTPWTSLSYFTDKFRELYKDPAAFRSASITKGIRPPVYRIRDIPEDKGEYAFLGRVVSRKHVDDNDPARVEKRGGKRRVKDTHFINVTFEDDTGEVSATINRFKASQYNWLLEEDLSGRDFLIRGNVIEQGRRWLFVDKIIEIK